MTDEPAVTVTEDELAAEPVAAVQAAPQAPEPPAEMTVDEFCADRSRTDGRIELIGAFHSDEVRADRRKDTPANFEARLVAFANRPVG